MFGIFLQRWWRWWLIGSRWRRRLSSHATDVNRVNWFDCRTVQLCRPSFRMDLFRRVELGVERRIHQLVMKVSVKHQRAIRSADDADWSPVRPMIPCPWWLISFNSSGWFISIQGRGCPPSPPLSFSLLSAISMNRQQSCRNWQKKKREKDP